jgi:hypothetical protein
MTRSRWMLAFALVTLAWLIHSTGSTSDDPDAESSAGPSRSAVAISRIDALGRLRDGRIPQPHAARRGARGSVAIAGRVVDVEEGTGVGDVEVVLRGAAGEETAVAASDGTFRIEVPAGTYRAFVRDDRVLSIGRPARVRLPALPAADAANAPDEASMPVIVAMGDVSGLELGVMRGGIVTGQVVDPAGRPVAGAVVRAVSDRRPVLGSDVAETDATGTFELRLSAGYHALDAGHSHHAGVVESTEVEVVTGARVTVRLVLAVGCVIAGRVVWPGGAPAGDGAIERGIDGAGEAGFVPSGTIAADGTFRWATTRPGPVTLRAWPWKSPHSPSATFSCRDGARFEHVFELPARGPDISGVLVDATGAPVPGAYIDLEPLDPGGLAQQERTDAEGGWGVFSMPAGRYRVTAQVPGRGFVVADVTAPATNVRLVLGDTGRIEARTPLLASGSLELELGCIDLPGYEGERRIVAVEHHRFVVEDAPACYVDIVARWRGLEASAEAHVRAGGAAQVEIVIGPPRAKRVYGVVRDPSGQPIAGVWVTAEHPAGGAEATSDRDGRYELATFAGAQLFAIGSEDAVRVSFDQAASQHIDLVVDPQVMRELDEILLDGDVEEEPAGGE